MMFLVLAGLAASASAWGQANPMFQHMDSNHDGRISLQEHAAAEQATFNRMDVNHDGKLTADEMRTARLALGVAETSGDERAATAAENAAVAQALFERLDTDHDGRVSSAEMQAAHSRPADAGNGDAHPVLGAGAALDANHDGVVNAAEHAHIARARFAKMDINQDGFVSAQEWDSAHAAKKPASP
ncbi:EF-hand domain-containing protein [Cognatiluteimonas profundi]|uniref:EF-hand domain-containing protein n=1 Tax=Cognatiluteimonas profundi TaxID=2594501 RepID=UPI0018EEDC0A|nr:EF-hand domain-containing protein [Lysobacter profundi]